MIFVYIIIGIIVLSVIINFISTFKNEMKLSNEVEKMGAKEGLFTTHVEGLGVGNIECKVIRFDNRLLIEANNHKFEIQMSQMRAAVVKSEQELIEKGKSVVGRALIGTLLVPGLGTIVGGMSGIGTKKKKGKMNYYMILNYIDSKGDLAAITFQDPLEMFIRKFCNNLNKSIPITNDIVQL